MKRRPSLHGNQSKPKSAYLGHLKSVCGSYTPMIPSTRHTGGKIIRYPQVSFLSNSASGTSGKFSFKLRIRKSIPENLGLGKFNKIFDKISKFLQCIERKVIKVRSKGNIFGLGLEFQTGGKNKIFCPDAKFQISKFIDY